MRKQSTSSGYNMGKLFLRTTAILLLSACSLDRIVEVSESEVGREVDRAALRSRDGAIGLYRSALGSFTSAMSGVSHSVGALTDELQVFYSIATGSPQPSYVELDSRTESQDILGNTRLLLQNSGYNTLHAARVQSSQARHLLRNYGTPADSALIANAYAIEGFAIVLLAEVMCSGIPLTQVPFEGEVEYSPAVPTDDMFKAAVVMFDSALAIEHDNTSFLTFARIGKGRALLGLGEFQKAGEAVAEVQQGDRFRVRYTNAVAPGTEIAGASFWLQSDLTRRSYMIGNSEGGNGLDWISTPWSQQDVRIPIDTTSPSQIQQVKYRDGTADIEVANWTIAKLIEAEALLSDPAAGNQWLQILNNLRSSRGITPLSDPENIDARVNLLFRERAFWLYLDGTRLGDYRRLVRHYGRSAYNVYPVGTYIKSPEVFIYGDAFVFSPPPQERTQNHLYTGCLSKTP